MRRIESTRWTLRGTGTGGTVLTLLLAALLLPGPWARAQDDDDDSDDHLYTELTKFGSEVELGFLWNADDSFQFGNYTGLERDGFYVLGNVDTMWRGLLGDDDASYLRLRGLNLGLDSRYADLEFGQQGRYGLFVEYDHPPYLLVRRGPDFVFVNFEDPDETRALFAELRERWTAAARP